jgi:hypothetical protein
MGIWALEATRATAEDGATLWTEAVGVDAVRAIPGVGVGRMEVE